MSLLLDVPFSEKDEVKALGAKWDPQLKKWYVKSKYDYPRFKKWILGNKSWQDVLCDHLYIIVAHKECKYCHKPTNVIGFGVEHYYHFYNQTISNSFSDNDKGYSYSKYYINLCTTINGLPDHFYDFLKREYNYYRHDPYYISNNCQHCNANQSTIDPYIEHTSPFQFNSDAIAPALKFYCFKLKFDLLVEFRMIDEYCMIEEDFEDPSDIIDVKDFII